MGKVYTLRCSGAPGTLDIVSCRKGMNLSYRDHCHCCVSSRPCAPYTRRREGLVLHPPVLARKLNSCHTGRAGRVRVAAHRRSGVTDHRRSGATDHRRSGVTQPQGSHQPVAGYDSTERTVDVLESVMLGAAVVSHVVWAGHGWRTVGYTDSSKTTPQNTIMLPMLTIPMLCAVVVSKFRGVVARKKREASPTAQAMLRLRQAEVALTDQQSVVGSVMKDVDKLQIRTRLVSRDTRDALKKVQESTELSQGVLQESLARLELLESRVEDTEALIHAVHEVSAKQFGLISQLIQQQQVRYSEEEQRLGKTPRHGGTTTMRGTKTSGKNSIGKHHCKEGQKMKMEHQEDMGHNPGRYNSDADHHTFNDQQAAGIPSHDTLNGISNSKVSEDTTEEEASMNKDSATRHGTDEWGRPTTHPRQSSYSPPRYNKDGSISFTFEKHVS